MDQALRKEHWENIYRTKEIDEVSWYQPTPESSLKFITDLDILKTAKIIDIGGGDSFLVDYLLQNGYKNITVLDISAEALERAKKRLGKRAENVIWIASDVTSFEPKEQYDLWHDRAAFHFFTESSDVAKYIQVVNKSIKPGGGLVVGTFSNNGPKKCSGLEIKQYSEKSLMKCFSNQFDKIGCEETEHHTPFNTIQSFLFCRFKKRKVL